MDCVLSTLVLCSVQNQIDVLKEIKRVLKPGGYFYFMEHVYAKDGSYMSFFQRLLNPLNGAILDGCNVIRTTLPNILDAGFQEVVYERFDAKLQYIFAGDTQWRCKSCRSD